MLPPVPCVAPLSCSVSSTHPGRSPSVWTRTAAWALLSGACAGRGSQQTTTSNIWKSGHRLLSFLSVDSCLLSRLHLLVSVCTRAISRSWFHRWSWRATHLCGLQPSASTKCASRSARTQSWRCAPKDWVHRQKHCGSVCLFSCWTVSLRGNNKPQRFSCTKLKWFSSNSPFPCGAVAPAP